MSAKSWFFSGMEEGGKEMDNENLICNLLVINGNVIQDLLWYGGLVLMRFWLT